MSRIPIPNDSIPEWVVVTSSDAGSRIVPGDRYWSLCDEYEAAGYLVADIPRDELAGMSGTSQTPARWGLVRDIIFHDIEGRNPTPEEILVFFPAARAAIIEAFDPNNLVHVVLKHEQATS